MQVKKLVLSAVLAFAAGTATASQPGSALAPARGGLWEVDDKIGGAPPQRMCIADPSMLANIEHRRQRCTRLVISEQRASALFHYTCPATGFGRTQLTLITPRSIRIETQGISGNAPFHYVLQARRIGDC